MVEYKKPSEYVNYDKLDPSEYIRYKFKSPGNTDTYNVCSDFLLQCLSDYFASMDPPGDGSLKVLDYGCGPTVINVISVAPLASEIVLADYTQSYIQFVRKWLNSKPEAYDWSPYFKHVVQTLEKQPAEEVVKREEQVRSKVKAVVSCDINQENIIADGYEGPYDVVMSFHCLDSGCRSLDSFKEGIKSLTALLKPGGRILLYTSKRENVEVGYYTINEKMAYDALPLSKDFMTKSMEEAGLSDIQDRFIANTPDEQTNVQGFYFFSGKKKRLPVIE